MIRYFLIWAVTTCLIWFLVTYISQAPKSHFFTFLKCAAFSTAAAILLSAVVILF